MQLNKKDINKRDESLTKNYIKTKSKTTQIKSKVYQNTFSCLGYKGNHKFSNLQKHLNKKRLKQNDKNRPLNDREKRKYANKSKIIK